MCDPLTISAIVLGAGSTFANYLGNQQVMNAQQEAMALHNQRQQQLDTQAAAVTDQSRDRYQEFGGQQEQKAQELGEFLQSQVMQEPSPGATMPASQSSITVREEERQRAAARDRTAQSAENLARYRSFGDLLGGIMRAQSRDAGDIDQISRFKQGWASVLPAQLQAANESGQGWRTLGDLFAGGSSIAFGAGAMPGGFPLGGGADPWNGLRTVGNKVSLRGAFG